MSYDLEELESLTDEQLCFAAADSEPALEELILRQRKLVRVCARPYFLRGGDLDDLLQEGMIGLLHAIRSFRAEGGAAFRTYAASCIRNRMISVVRAAETLKNLPLNDSISFQAHSFINAQDDFCFSDLCLERSPEDDMISREEFSEFVAALTHKLSTLEKQVLGLYLKGLSYQEIAVQVQKSTKAVDNAVQRIRFKVARQTKHGVNGNSAVRI